VAGRIRSIEKFCDLIGNQTHDLPAFSIVPNPSSRTIALGLTQPLTEVSTRDLPGDDGRCVRLTTSLPSVS
jgi:hypothetical protein